jgi:hypothetical protein
MLSRAVKHEFGGLVTRLIRGGRPLRIPPVNGSSVTGGRKWRGSARGSSPQRWLLPKSAWSRRRRKQRRLHRRRLRSPVSTWLASSDGSTPTRAVSRFTTIGTTASLVASRSVTTGPTTSRRRLMSDERAKLKLSVMDRLAMGRYRRLQNTTIATSRSRSFRRTSFPETPGFIHIWVPASISTGSGTGKKDPRSFPLARV